jgi:lysozyme family protein
MNTTSKEIIMSVVGIEGGYTDDRLDSGGKTKYGITKKVARRFGYTGKIKKLPLDIALDIYKRGYWNKISGDALLKIGGEALVSEMFEQAVNMGVGRAGRNLQRVLNIMNNGGRYYQDLVADGDIGAKTIEALTAYAKKRGTAGIKVLTAYLNAMQGSFYIELAENREKDERFVYGWGLNRVVGVTA